MNRNAPHQPERFRSRVLSPGFAAAGTLALSLTACGFKDDARWLDVQSSALFAPQGTQPMAPQSDEIAEIGGNCSAQLEVARASLDDTSSPALRSLVQRCAKDGLTFNGELRCMDGSLQLRCD